MTDTLKPKDLLEGDCHRLVLHASLEPNSGLDRFQPAGFPEVGHVLYDSPGENRSKICIVDSAASMANHLESVCLANSFSQELHSDLDGMPYVQCFAQKKDSPDRLVMTSLTEGHRLASGYFVDSAKAHLGSVDGDPFLNTLKQEFGLQELGNNTHPPSGRLAQRFQNDIQIRSQFPCPWNSFPALGIKIPRVLTAHLEAHGASRVSSSGVKI